MLEVVSGCEIDDVRDPIRGDPKRERRRDLFDRELRHGKGHHRAEKCTVFDSHSGLPMLGVAKLPATVGVAPGLQNHGAPYQKGIGLALSIEALWKTLGASCAADAKRAPVLRPTKRRGTFACK